MCDRWYFEVWSGNNDCVCVCVLIYGADVHSGFNEFPEISIWNHATVNQSHPQRTKQPDSGSFIFTICLSVSTSFLLPLYSLFSQAITKLIYTCTIVQLFHTNSFHKTQKNIQMMQITITWHPGLHTKLRVYYALLICSWSLMVDRFEV